MQWWKCTHSALTLRNELLCHSIFQHTHTHTHRQSHSDFLNHIVIRTFVLETDTLAVHHTCMHCSNWKTCVKYVVSISPSTIYTLCTIFGTRWVKIQFSKFSWMVIIVVIVVYLCQYFFPKCRENTRRLHSHKCKMIDKTSTETEIETQQVREWVYRI